MPVRACGDILLVATGLWVGAVKPGRTDAPPSPSSHPMQHRPPTAPGAEIRGSAGTLSSLYRRYEAGNEVREDSPPLPGACGSFKGRAAGRERWRGRSGGCSPRPSRGRPELAAAAGHGAHRHREDQALRRPETRHQRAAQAGGGLPEQCPLHRELHPEHPGHRAAHRTARGHAGGGGGTAAST